MLSPLLSSLCLKAYNIKGKLEASFMPFPSRLIFRLYGLASLNVDLESHATKLGKNADNDHRAT